MLLLLLACRPPEEGAPLPQSQPIPGWDAGEAPEAPLATAWTVLVYMNGDNNLEGYVVHDLNELEAGGEGGRVRVLVQADRIEGYNTEDGDWQGTRRYEIVGDDDLNEVTSPVKEDLGEVDMGDPAVLADFLAWGRAVAPAERYAVFLWNHGDSWTFAPPPADDEAAPPPSISSDDTSGSWISVAEGELVAGLDAFVAAEGPIDLLGFDACYMASFEVAYALRSHARLMLASEAWVGGEGVLYTPLLQSLREDPEQDGVLLADTAAELSVVEGRERTFSAIDLQQMGLLAAEVDALGAWGLGAGEDLDGALLSAGAADPDWPSWYLDLADLGRVAQAAGAPLALDEAVEQAVIGAYGNGRYDWTGGLTLFGDLESPGYFRLYQEGAGAVWSQDTRWDEALASRMPR